MDESRLRTVNIKLDALHIGQAKLVASIYGNVNYAAIIREAIDTGLPVIMRECDEYQSKRMKPEDLAKFEEHLKEIVDKAEAEAEAKAKEVANSNDKTSS